MKKIFIIQQRETGSHIAYLDTMHQAEKQLEAYEEQDKKDGTYEPDFYEITEMFQNKHYIAFS